MVIVPTATHLAVELGFLGQNFLAQIPKRERDLLRCFAHGGEEVTVDAWTGSCVNRVYGVSGFRGIP